MATLQTPPPQSPPPPQRSRANEEIEPFAMPILLEQLQDELTRSRKREAFWMSLFAHAVIIIILFTSSKWIAWIPARSVEVATPQELISKHQELTYLYASPDEQKLKERPKTNVLSDKDRLAGSPRPQISQQELKKLIDNGRPGAPGPVAQPSRPPVPPQMAQQSPPANRGVQNPPQQTQSGSSQAPIYPTQMARSQAAPNPFATGARSAGSAIEQAAQAAAASRGGGGGDYGIRSPNNSPRKSGFDILSDTLGVDFGPYLSRIHSLVDRNWKSSLPESAFPPMMKKGSVVVQVAIMKDGSVRGMKLITSSGDVSLDRAAWAGINLSAPFPPLPNEFGGNYLLLNADFECNTEKYSLR